MDMSIVASGEGEASIDTVGGDSAGAASPSPPTLDMSALQTLSELRAKRKRETLWKTCLETFLKIFDGVVACLEPTR